MKKVLVLMSTYNGERYIKEQLDSILHQRHPVDILIRDDGSSDATITILNEYKNKHSNIKVLEEKNKGVVDSFFSLMTHAHGYDYYAFSDQDDIWFDDKIECAVQHLDALDPEKPALYASCSLLVDNNLQGEDTTQIDRRGLSFYNVMIQNLMPGHAQVFNQKLVDFVNAYPVDTTKVVVHDFWLALIGITFGNTYFDNQYHTYYRQHGSNSIGYGHGPFGWFNERIKRILRSAAKDITIQDKLFYDTFKMQLNEEQKNELEGLLFSQRNLFTRLHYLCKAKVYRQKKIETALFYILYALGGYKVRF